MTCPVCGIMCVGRGGAACTPPILPPLHSDPCDRAPPGWVCTREYGHDGPCAAWPLFDDLPVVEDSGLLRRALNWVLERLARLFT